MNRIVALLISVFVFAPTHESIPQYMSFDFQAWNVVPSTTTAATNLTARYRLRRQEKSAPSRKQPASKVLVTPDWLAKHISDPNIRLIGLGQTSEQYIAAHIPGEVFIEWKKDITDPNYPDRFNLPPQEQLEALLSRVGVTPEMTIVISDNMSSRLSARMFWTLKYYGHKNIKLLDGGRKGWIQSGRSFVKTMPDIKPTKYKITEVNAKHHAKLTNVKAHLEDNSTCIVDGRPIAHYTGEKPGKTFHTGKEHKRRGHIVSAYHVEWTQNFNKDGTFKSPEELRELYATIGATADHKIITYCNEGLHAAPPWFVLTELLGYPDVQLYDDSMAEWANRDDTPMEVSKDATDN